MIYIYKQENTAITFINTDGSQPRELGETVGIRLKEHEQFDFCVIEK